MLAWRLLHEPSLQDLPAWLALLLPRTPPGFDRDPIALALAGLATLAAFVYLALAVFRAGFKARLLTLAVAATSIVVAPTLGFVAMGFRSDRPYGQDGGVVQLPLALDKILAGQSPYGADYSDSVLGRQARSSAFWEPYGGNPILRHHAYLPGTHVIFMPFYLLFARGAGFFDPRLVTLLAYAAAAFLATRLARGDEARLIAAAAVCLNPLVYWHQIFGANDVVFVALLLAAFLCVRQSRPVLAGVALGLACATKQLAWPFAPFLLLLLSGASSWRALATAEPWKRVARPATAAAFTFALAVLPIAALDLRAFYGDIVVYNVGLPGADNYPLGGTPGFGFANLLIYFGRVASLRDYFPFGVFYVLLVPLGLLLVGRQLRDQSLGTALLSGACALAASLYFSRVVHPNYLVPLAMLVPLACLLRRTTAAAAAVPLLLLSLAVEVVENEVFRPTWDQAVAAGYPRTARGLFARLVPLAGPSLTADPIGLLFSGVAAGLAVALICALALGLTGRWRTLLAAAAVAATTVVPALLMIDVSQRTGIRGQDAWVVQQPADVARLREAASPYQEPAADRPQGRQAWSTSFRLEPPALLEPHRPQVPPGAAMLGLPLRLFGYADPRWLTLAALLGLVLVIARSGGETGVEVGLLALMPPIAFGAVFGSPHALTAILALAAVVVAWKRRPLVAGSLASATAAVDALAIPLLPFLVRGAWPDAGPRRVAARACLITLAVLILTVAALGPGWFLSAILRGPVIGPGLGLVNLGLYVGLSETVLGVALVAGGGGAAAIMLAAARRMGADVPSALSLAALASLLTVLVVPGLSPEAAALPIGLGVLAAARTPGGSVVPR